MEENFSKLINLLWGECIQNINSNLEEEEQGKFSNNDYYYLLMIQSMNQPNFSAIAEQLQMTKPAVTAVVRKLQKMNLVEKTQSEKDKRMYYVSLTPKGEKLLSGDRAVYQWMTDTMNSLCKDEQEQKLIENIINQLVERLEVKLNDR